MSLILEGVALAIDGAALVIDCACCIKEKCEAIVCANDVDCDEAGKTPDAECFCRAKKCTSNPSCVNDDDCPDGYECVDGICVPECRGQPCTGDGDCPDDCVCLEGGCWNKDNVYYCHGDPDDSNADGECKEGVPELSKGGPYLSYGLCAQSGCKSKFSCNPVIGDCYPDAAGIFEDLPTCQTNCGDGTDQGRCCESVVCYDADGNVTGVTQQCAELGINGTPCCGGSKVPIDPDNPGAGERCVDTNSCSKQNCISDPPLQTGQVGCRTFRQFNSLFDDCDLCPTLGLGPCCYEVDGVATCDMHDKGYCTDVLGGTWKGNNWFTCEDARESQVDLLLDFACPNCNGAGDCSCGGNEYCYGQKCNDCNNPVTVDHLSYTTIDENPRRKDEWKFRSRDCEDGVSTQDQQIDIYGQWPDGTRDLLFSVDNSDTNSIGQTLWTNTNGCYWKLVARKTVGSPDTATLCKEKTQHFGNEGCNCTVNSYIYPTINDPQPEPDGSNISIGRTTNEPPFFVWQWKTADYPNCLGTKGQEWWWVNERRVAVRTDDGVLKQTLEENFAIYQCVDGEFVDVTDDAITYPKEITQEFCGGIPTPVGSALRRSYSVRDANGPNCQAQAGWDSFGDFAETPVLNDGWREPRFNCENFRVENPLP